MAYRIGLSDRFWSKVDIKEPDECWNWKGAKYDSGYGEFYYSSNGRIRAHRMAYELTNGQFSDDILCLHKCDNRLCCNPNHLYLGTVQDNMKDKQLRYKGPYLGSKPRKFDDETVYEMQKLSKSGMIQLEIANRFGLSRGHVSKLLRMEVSNKVGLDNNLS